jgi:hypothetical protein
MLQQFFTTLTLWYRTRVIGTQEIDKGYRANGASFAPSRRIISRDLLALELYYWSRRFQIARDIGKRPSILDARGVERDSAIIDAAVSHVFALDAQQCRRTAKKGLAWSTSVHLPKQSEKNVLNMIGLGQFSSCTKVCRPGIGRLVDARPHHYHFACGRTNQPWVFPTNNVYTHSLFVASTKN